MNRVHNGIYICVANNGIPPAANATFQIEVQCKYVLNGIYVQIHNHIFYRMRLWINWSLCKMHKRYSMNSFDRKANANACTFSQTTNNNIDKKKIILDCSRRFFFLVSFLIVPPLIRVRNQYLYAFEGGSVSLECEVSTLFSSTNHFVLHFNFLVGKSIPFWQRAQQTSLKTIIDRKKRTFQSQQKLVLQ